MSSEIRSLRRAQKTPCAFNDAFTVLEILAVLTIVLILTALLTPAFISLTKSNGRKAAIGNLLGTIEQARTQAIKDGQSTYVVFATLGGGTAQAILDRYNYKSYAIFEDDPANPGTQKQLTQWSTLPAGVSLRSAISSAPWVSASFAFNPIGAAQSFPYLKFNANGEVESPTVVSGSIQLKIFEGFVNGTSDKPTNQSNFTEIINVAPNTGRATYTP